MQIIQLPRLLHTIITEPVKAHNAYLGFIERIAIVGNVIEQHIKLLPGTMPVKRFGKFNHNCVTAALKNKIKNSVILLFSSLEYGCNPLGNVINHSIGLLESCRNCSFTTFVLLQLI